MSFLQKIGKHFKFYTKGFVALCTLMVSASYGVLCSVFLSLIGKRNLAQWSTARFYYYLFSTVMRITIEIEGEEKLSGLPAILISNHQSELDVFMLGRIFPKRCVVTAKKQLQLVPFLGWFMTLSGTFFLDRSDREKAIRVLNKALDDLKATSGGLFMFPEGTRSYSSRPTLLPFKKGAFHLAVQAQIPIIPLVVSNTSNIYSLKERNFNTGTIKVKVLEPISTEGLTKDDVNKLVEATYAKMEEEIRKVGMSVVAGDVSGESEALLSQEVQ
ncbi:1-acyl-sn-glycerol-3-phosphate acyltransferase [Ogataea parapolymorpha DL-1]|uniref:1-acyl-sn-glycerol-3-phosphate acyltransferase n=1 Tax=Ogataea parapolymorpha (strain ATCC 26012 / BCRC 20466 / JCM 22074 / NRRL Y-7560 / DL-1) TaxID=871575 RepID=W1QAU2_OGAPD|nr:1-acyl-sn-glycerol-3-phosphate acyltransferase [Ogataea parapolymorpha DL-1]ESW97514.1 1-acyl-sn-glycerol-3-phosphate acyltransferase [Ogataea parapolymorpha DL-1]